MTAASKNPDDTRMTFLKVLFAAQRKFYEGMEEGWNPFSVMQAMAFETVNELSDADLTAVLLHRPQAFALLIDAETLDSGPGSKFKMRDAVVDALVTEVVGNFDISGLDRDTVSKWADSTPDFLRHKVDRFLAGPRLTVVGGNF
ncbi:hypothetical protein [Rhizobium sp. BK176]|uniref:hypothetical protein n=1 Tax=Rhizobium sp. BK176 TaxID=2587071 RepID=UPI002167FC6F|nr:hypothetical protein [Rhizobium sp. BK176]MCS4089687.1 hypothetical protein [Rhizobium sp. BK176]